MDKKQFIQQEISKADWHQTCRTLRALERRDDAKEFAEKQLSIANASTTLDDPFRAEFCGMLTRFLENGVGTTMKKVKTWLDDLKPGDKVVVHIPDDDNLVEIRFVYGTGMFIRLTKGAMWFDRKTGYTEDGRIFLSPYFPQLEGVLPVWGEPPKKQ